MKSTKSQGMIPACGTGVAHGDQTCLRDVGHEGPHGDGMSWWADETAIFHSPRCESRWDGVMVPVLCDLPVGHEGQCVGEWSIPTASIRANWTKR